MASRQGIGTGRKPIATGARDHSQIAASTFNIRLLLFASSGDYSRAADSILSEALLQLEHFQRQFVALEMSHVQEQWVVEMKQLVPFPGR